MSGAADFDFGVAKKVEFGPDGSRFHSAVHPILDGIGVITAGRRLLLHFDLDSGETVRFTMTQFALLNTQTHTHTHTNKQPLEKLTRRATATTTAPL